MEREVGDVDWDGHLDIVISDSGLPALIVFNGNGNAGFTRETISTPYGRLRFWRWVLLRLRTRLRTLPMRWRGTHESLRPLSSTTRYHFGPIVYRQLQFISDDQMRSVALLSYLAHCTANKTHSTRRDQEAVDTLDPAGKTRHWPRRQQRRVGLGFAAPQTTH